MDLDEAALIIRAASGSIAAWADIEKRSDQVVMHSAAALLMLDDDPHPVAMVHALAALGDNASEPALDRARRAIRAITASDVPHVRRMNAACHAAIADALDADAPKDVRCALPDIIANAPGAVWRVAERVWDVMDASERLTFIRAVLRHGHALSAGILLARLGVDGLLALAQEERAALIAAASRHPVAAAAAIVGAGKARTSMGAPIGDGSDDWAACSSASMAIRPLSQDCKRQE